MNFKRLRQAFTRPEARKMTPMTNSAFIWKKKLRRTLPQACLPMKLAARR